jgi:hypothetical protein
VKVVDCGRGAYNDAMRKLRGPPRRRNADSFEGAIDQAQYMIRIYAEILAMDDTILERVKQLVASDDGDREAKLANLRLLLAQLEKVGQRLAYWNARVRELLEDQLAG